MTTATQQYSFTEKKRIRKDFGKSRSILEVPFLLAIQVDSYREFLQEHTEASKRADRGLHGLDDGGMLTHGEVVVAAPDRDVARRFALAVEAGAGKGSDDAFEFGEDAVTPFVAKAFQMAVEEGFVVHGLVSPAHSLRAQGAFCPQPQSVALTCVKRERFAAAVSAAAE